MRVRARSFSECLAKNVCSLDMRPVTTARAMNRPSSFAVCSARTITGADPHRPVLCPSAADPGRACDTEASANRGPDEINENMGGGTS